MISDKERREVARRLRRAWANVPDKNPVRHHMRVLYEIYAAVGLNDDGVDAIDLFNLLADLIDPGELKTTCIAEVKIEGEKLDEVVNRAIAEYTGIDRDALLALADDLDYAGVAVENVAYIDQTFHESARCIREACGEVADHAEA